MTDIRSVMEEPVGGDNHGRVNGEPLDVQTQQGVEAALRGDAFSVVGPDVPNTDGGGLVAHRGVLHPDEYVDPDQFQQAVEAELGYTYAEVKAVYKAGGNRWLTPTQREFRAYIDARLLALSRSGTNVTELAEAIGIGRATLNRALERARALHVEPQVRNPVVLTKRVCFKCGSPGARARRRRFSTSPEQWRGTIDLCDPCVREGYEAEWLKAHRVGLIQNRAPVTAADAAASRERIARLLEKK